MASAAPSYRDTDSDASAGRILLIIALAVTALAYLATLHFAFVYDDGPQIIHNLTLTSWSTLPKLFTEHSWKFLLPEFLGNYYRPLFMSWLLVNRKLFGLNPFAFHATTVLVHLLVTWMCFVVARQVLRSATKAGYVAILFGLHPIHVESVAWISGVTEPLMAVFVLAAFWAWIKSKRQPEHAALFKLLSAVFYAAGCLCKETALLLPVVVVAHDVLFGYYERNLKGMVKAAWSAVPLWITAVAYLGAREAFLHGLIHPEPNSIWQIAMTVPTILWGYVRRLVWPVRLSVFYDTPPVTSLLQVRFWLPFLALIVAGVLVWRIGKRSRIVGFSMVWIFTFLVPAIIGIPAFALGEWIHDRYLYLPSFGFCLLLVYAISQLPSRREIFGLPATPALVVMFLSVGMALGTTYEEQFWATDFLLFARGTQVSPYNALAKSHLANEFFRVGDVKKTEQLYQEALSLDPTNWKNHVAYGLVLYYSHQYDRADEAFQKSSAMFPADPNQYFYQGLSRFNLEHFADAERAFDKAIQYGPDHVRYHFWRGFALEKQGKFQEAKSEYEKELQLHPETDTQASEKLANLESELSHQK